MTLLWAVQNSRFTLAGVVASAGMCMQAPLWELNRSYLPSTIGGMGDITNARLDRLTGLRFVAAFAVFGFHAVVFFEGPTRDVMDWVFGQGRSGVSFFFVLSGFLLAWSSRPGDRPLDFYRRRLSRIYPAYLLALLIATVLWVLRDPAGLQNGLLTLFLVQAWVPDSEAYFAVNVPAWSLSVEAFFYLSFPLAIVLLRQLRAGRLWLVSSLSVAVIVAIAFIASFWIAPDGISGNTVAVWAAVYFPLARLPEFLLGMALALLFKRGALPHVPWALAIVIVTAAYVSMSVWPSVYGVAAQCIVPFAILIVAAAQRDVGGTGGWLRNAWVIHAGAASYCFYLVHHIFVVRLSQPGIAALGLEGWAAWVVALVLSAMTAWVMHRYVEIPMDKRLRGRTARPSVALDA